MVGVLLAVSLSVTACAGMGEGAMVKDPDLKKQAAIEQTLEYLERTEASLPEGMTLSWTFGSPDADGNFVQNSSRLPCSSSDGADLGTDPQLVYVSYFVSGVPDGEGAKYLKQICGLWESWGWTPTKEPDEQSAAYVNEAGYTLSLQTSVQGDISITGETPCIAAKNFTGGEEVPQRTGKPSRTHRR